MTYVGAWWGSCSCIEASLGPPVACHQCTMGDHCRGDHHMGDHHPSSSLRTGTKSFAALDCQTIWIGRIRLVQEWIGQGQVNGQTPDVDGLANQVSLLWRSDWGRSWGYGEGAKDTRPMEKWWWDCCSLLTVFYMGLLPWVLPKNMGGGHDPVE